MIGLFELPEDQTLNPDDHFVEVEDAPGYSPAYSQLAYAQKPQHDPLSGKYSAMTTYTCIKYVSFLSGYIFMGWLT